MTTVAILVHPGDPIDHAPYFITAFAERWRRDGMRVEIVRGPDRFVPADVAILHVDLTRVPAPYLKLLARYPRAVNAATGDISKRRISDRRVSRPSGWDGPVIVKSDRNHGGLMERNKRTSGLSGALARLGDRLPWWISGRFNGNNYPIFASTRDVPRLAWLHPRLLVERLVTERRGDDYCVRRWIFFGSRGVNYANVGTVPHITREHLKSKQVTGPPPDELRELRAQLGFDFGKFDYAIVDGRVVLYDVNRTPNVRMSREAFFAPYLDDLAAGLLDFLPREQPAGPAGRNARPCA